MDIKNKMDDRDTLITSLVLKVAAMENLLVKFKVFSSEELIEEMKKVSEEIKKTMEQSFKNKEISN